MMLNNQLVHTTNTHSHSHTHLCVCLNNDERSKLTASRIFAILGLQEIHIQRVHFIASIRETVESLQIVNVNNCAASQELRVQKDSIERIFKPVISSGVYDLQVAVVLIVNFYRVKLEIVDANEFKRRFKTLVRRRDTATPWAYAVSIGHAQVRAWVLRMIDNVYFFSYNWIRERIKNDSSCLVDNCFFEILKCKEY